MSGGGEYWSNEPIVGLIYGPFKALKNYFAAHPELCRVALKLRTK